MDPLGTCRLYLGICNRCSITQSLFSKNSLVVLLVSEGIVFLGGTEEKTVIWNPSLMYICNRAIAAPWIKMLVNWIVYRPRALKPVPPVCTVAALLHASEKNFGPLCCSAPLPWWFLNYVRKARLSWMYFRAFKEGTL